MKKVLFFLSLIIFNYSLAYGDISFTKTWSDTDNGSTFDGSDIGDIQSDIISQSVDKSGTQTVSGNKTFSGTVAFTGTVTGVGGGAKDSISRGFELVWDGPPQVLINPGTLYHGTTQVDLTSQSHVEVTTAGDWIDGSAKDYSGGAGWAYVYVGDTNAKLYFDENAPNSADTSGNTAGTNYYYTTGGNYYRCIGAVRISTGNTVAAVWNQQSNIIMWDQPVNITTTVSAGVWSAATSCATAMPSISKIGIFGLTSTGAGGGSSAGIWVRPNGSTWATNFSNGIYSGANSAVPVIGGQRQCVTDSSQQIQSRNGASDAATRIDVEGYILSIR